MECRECTLCCKLLDVPELNKPANKDCIFCVPKEGCSIWKIRPNVCRGFECAYYQQDSAPLQLRPDQCHVIFEKLSDKVMFGSEDSEHSMTATAIGQINSFVSQGYSVIIANRHKKIDIHLAKGHTEKEIRSVLEERRNRWLLHHTQQT